MSLVHNKSKAWYGGRPHLVFPVIDKNINVSLKSLNSLCSQ